jgi:2-oxoisovalerate dehydrogenase E1 component
MAIAASEALVQSLGVSAPRISCVICSTTSPCEASPAIACHVLGYLARLNLITDDCYAYDINAACSGFLFALRNATDFLAACPDDNVLVVTSEAMSLGVDPNDFNTAFLFGDAATATLVTRVQQLEESLVVTRPVLRTKPDHHRSLHIPNFGTGGYLAMDGMAVALEANKAMSELLSAVALDQGLHPAELSFVVPHPGNKRILQNIARRLEIDESRILHTLADTGNTSSSSIPITLDRYWNVLPTGKPIGLVAFGAGFTSAAAIGYRCANKGITA